MTDRKRDHFLERGNQIGEECLAEECSGKGSKKCHVREFIDKSNHSEM